MNDINEFRHYDLNGKCDRCEKENSASNFVKVAWFVKPKIYLVCEDCFKELSKDPHLRGQSASGNYIPCTCVNCKCGGHEVLELQYSNYLLLEKNKKIQKKFEEIIKIIEKEYGEEAALFIRIGLEEIGRGPPISTTI